jgi:phage shock protein PspC (stress-responsive transcriptional regulator)
MKKTLTANISGTVFHIEEDAFEALQRYLASIRGQFAGSDGQDEIMADIEARIAELFTERLEGRGQVVTMSDVEHVVHTMGQPEDYLGDTDEGTTSSTFNGRKAYKRLFRDPDDSWVGGVLGGLAAYIGADPLWLRIPFIILVILGIGSPILIYLLLWILVPKASTAAERLMMEGEPVTVDNLKRSFEEGGQRVAKEVEELGERWSGQHAKGAARAMRRGAHRVARSTSRALAVIIGIVLFLIGISLGISLIGALVGGSVLAFDSFDGDHGIGLADLGRLIFPSGDQAMLFSVSLFLLLLIPVVGILTAGLQLMLGLRAPRWIGWTLGPVWIVSLLLVIFIGVRLGRDFQRSEPLVTTTRLEAFDGQVLYLTNLDVSDGMQQWRMHYGKGVLAWDFDGLRVTEDSVHGGWARLDVARSPDADFHLRVVRATQGASHKASLWRSTNVAFTTLQQDSLLGVSPWLSFPKEDKLRGQRLRFVVLVPIGKAVYFDPDMGFMLDDVKNVTNTLDRDMVGRTWTMTPNGLSSSVRPEDVPDDMFPQLPGPAAQPGTSTLEAGHSPARRHSANTEASEGRSFIMPDLISLLRPGF